MKKLIIISVIFALVAGSVFAADVSVDVIGKATLIKGSDQKQYAGVDLEKGTPLDPRTEYNGTSFGISRARISASGETEDGKIGGWLRFDVADEKAYGSPVNAWGFVWWKPLDILKVQIGTNPDGEFGLDGVARWGFYASAGDAGVVNETWAFGDSFFGGWGGQGILLTATPIDALTINLGIPILNTTYFYDEGSSGNWVGQGKDYAFQNYKRFVLQAKYDIDGIGTAGLTYQNDLFLHEQVNGEPNNDNPKVWAYFGLTAVENLGLDVGIGFQFADSFYVDETTYTINNPLVLGVGATYDLGAFKVKGRVQAKFLGSHVMKADETYETSDGFGLAFDVLPYFEVDEKLTAYLSFGVGFTTGVESYNSDGDKEVDKSSLVNWHVNPYISLNYGAGAFYAGIRAESPAEKALDKDGKSVRVLNWSIPIGITIGF